MIELSAQITETLAMQLEDHFCEYTGISPWNLFRKDRSDPYLLRGYFLSEAEGDVRWGELVALFEELPMTPERKQIEDADWQNAYKAFLQPWVHRGLHWVPEWMRSDYELPEGDVALWFDAGMAFGTGSHETTRLCVKRMLDWREEKGQDTFASARLIDAGCGSGILAISAYLLGSRNVFGFDHDPEAVRVSNENLGLNDLPADVVPFSECGLEEGLKDKQADFMVANIQADVLKIYSRDVLGAIAPGGTLAMSGILAREVESVRDHYAKMATEIWGTEPTADIRVDGEWSDCCLVRG